VTARDVPLLFVPGVLGTTLVDASNPERVVWGSASGLLALRKLPFGASDNGLVPGEVLWTFTAVKGFYAVPVYEELALRLATMGYGRARIETPTQARALYGLSYDWRRDVASCAREVEEAVEHLKTSLGVPRVTLVAHSFGCSVVRYYLRYGGTDLLCDEPEAPRPGDANVEAFFALGPLASGTLRALHEANHGFTVAPLGLGIAGRQASSAPSLYQMLPFDDGRAVDELGRPVDLDLEKVETWKAHAWGPYRPDALDGRDEAEVREFLEPCLGRARRFWELSRERDPADDRVPTHSYTGRDARTLTKLVLTTAGDTFADDEEVARHHPDLLPRVTTLGDGYVALEDVRAHTRGTDLLPVAGSSHRYIYKNDEVLKDVVRKLGGES
jgi:pimeloyl-ACP methyl ester carboxylesterase